MAQMKPLMSLLFFGAGLVCAEENALYAGHTIPHWIAQLGSDDAANRAAAAKVLAQAGPAAAPALLAALAGRSAAACEGAATVLLLMPEPPQEAVPALIRAAGHRDPAVRVAAVKAIGHVARTGKERAGTVEAVGPVFVEALKDRHVSVREAAAEALEALGQAAARALPALALAAGDEASPVRRAALRTLEKLGPAARDALPALRRALKDKDEFARWHAVRALGAIGPDAAEAIPDMIPLLKDHKADVRLAGSKPLFDLGSKWCIARVTAHALGEIRAGPEKVIPALVEALRDDDHRVRQTAAESLARYLPEAKSALPRLTAMLLQENKAVVRAAAAMALAAFAEQAEEAGPALVEALGDREPWVAWEAAKALGRLGAAGRKALPRLKEVLSGDSPELRRSAAWALGELGPHAADAVEALTQAVRVGAGERKGGAARAAAMQALGRVEAPLQQAGPALAAALTTDADPDARRWGAIALGQYGPAAQAFVGDLVCGMSDKDDLVRGAAVEAVGRIGPGAARAVPSLMSVLADDREGQNRCLAARALGDIGPAAREALPLLDKLRQDRNWNLRHAAEEAAAKIAGQPGK